jgi:hypothetical protein
MRACHPLAEVLGIPTQQNNGRHTRGRDLLARSPVMSRSLDTEEPLLAERPD